MNEVWKPVKDYEGLYEISNYGRVKSLSKSGSKEEFICKTSVAMNTGYAFMGFHKHNKRKGLNIHKLVANAFLEKPETSEKLCVNHIDGNKLNNHVSNLEWVTYKRNAEHAYELGLNKKLLGKDNKATKYSDEQVAQMFKLFQEGKGTKEVSILLNIPITTVSGYRTGRKRTYLNIDKESMYINNNRGVNYNHLPKKTKQKVKELLLAGCSKIEIERQTGVSRKSKLIKLLVNDIS